MSDDLQDDGIDEAGMDGGDFAMEAHEAALAEADAERLARQAFLFGVDKQLFMFLFANCLFVVGALAAWEKAMPWVDADPSGMITGLDSGRGAMILALGLYGFWTAFLNIFHGQMKVWPYLLNAVLALWVGLGGISAGMDQWAEVGKWLKGQDKTVFKDVMARLGTIAPGPFLLAIGGILVIWVILTGLMKGASSGKAAAGDTGSRRRSR